MRSSSLTESETAFLKRSRCARLLEPFLGEDLGMRPLRELLVVILTIPQFSRASRRSLNVS